MRRLLDIDLQLIRVFRAIVEAQGLSGAQFVLNLSQPRVSARLAELEQRLGVKLCKRGRGGFALTEAGAKVYEASEDLFQAVDRFSNRAGLVSDKLRRVLRLGTVDALVTNDRFSLARALKRFRRHAPSVLVDFTMAGPEELERQLVAGSRDVAIMPNQNRRGELAYRKLFEERQSLYCARGHRLFEREEARIAPNDLEASAFVARSYLHSEDLKRVGHRGADATVETMEAQLILILSGEFIGYLPAHYAEGWVRRGQLRGLGEKTFSYNSVFYAASQGGAAENPLVQRFLDALGR
ncbi:MAG: LysR family transcriptional regulator [Parvibaculaceae bacterium]